MPTPPRLDGQQVAQICDALTAGFDRSDLRALTRIELDEELDVIAGGETMQDLALSLVDWAEETGRVGDLIAAMQRRNPTNPQVQALAQASAAWFGPRARSRPAGAAAPTPRARGAHASSSRRWIGALALLVLLALAAVFAIVRFGALFTSPPPPAAAGSAAAEPDAPAVAQTVAAMAAATAATAVASTPATDQSSAQPTRLTITTPDQEWNLGTRVYRILAASAVELNPAQTQIDLQLRMTNNGLGDELLTGADLHLLAGAATYTAPDAISTCYALVARAAARDDCRLQFVVNGAPSALTLRLQVRDAQTDIPLTLGGPPAAGTPAPAAPGGALTVQTPAGAWPVDQSTYQVLSVTTQPYDAARTAVTFHIAMANNDIASSALWGSSTRLLVDGVPRAPEDDWVSTCLGLVDAGQTGDRCTVKFIVPNTAADLKLRFVNLDRNTDATVPLTISHGAQ